MTAFCHPMPHQVAEDMLQVVARAICDRPGESPAQRESRTRQMVHSVTGLTPRDGLEYMLSSLVVGHYNLILDSLHEVFAGQADAKKARTKSTIVALDRAFIGMIRELRTERARPLMKWTEAARPETGAEARDDVTKDHNAAEANAPAEENAALVAEMALALREEAERAATGPARGTPTPNADRTPGTARLAGPAAGRAGRAAGHQPSTPAPSGTGEPTAAEQLADFERALAMMTATLDEARVPEHANGKAKDAGGH